MAAGDITFFEEFVRTLGEKKHNFSSDTIKVGLVTNGVTPTAGDTTPTWADYSGSEVSTAGGYTADGETLTTVTWTEADGVATLDADSIALAQNGSGFTNAYWAIIYNDTSADDDAIAFVDLGGPVSEQAGAVNINWDPGGIIGTEQGFGTDWYVDQDGTASELVTASFSSGVPATDVTSGANPGGSGSHTANRSGSYESGDGNSAAETHDWSGTTRGGWTSNKDHRITITQTGPTNGASVQMPIANSVAVSALGSSDNVKQQFVGSTITTNTGPTAYAQFYNSSGHWVRMYWDADAAGIKTAQIQYNGGSGVKSGSAVGTINIGTATYNEYRVVWDGSKTTDIDVYFNETAITSSGGNGPDFPAEFPGWASFGDITSFVCYIFADAGSGQTTYLYAHRVVLNGDFA